MSDVFARFLAKCERPDALACWRWTGHITLKGYGQFALEHRRIMQAHRYAYEACIGPIPPGLHLDHLCRVRACVNPFHLEPVTNLENTIRGNSPIRPRARCATTAA